MPYYTKYCKVAASRPTKNSVVYSCSSTQAAINGDDLSPLTIAMEIRNASVVLYLLSTGAQFQNVG